MQQFLLYVKYFVLLNVLLVNVTSFSFSYYVLQYTERAALGNFSVYYFVQFAFETRGKLTLKTEEKLRCM